MDINYNIQYVYLQTIIEIVNSKPINVYTFCNLIFSHIVATSRIKSKIIYMFH